jgi:type I restriction-modification system DNA methylase subunit/restriction endonuclease S subunit
MLTQETKRRINTARDILVGQLPLPSDQIELITVALIYKFMGDIDEQSRELGGKPTFFIGALRDLSWQKLISNTLSAEERVTKFIQGIEAISDQKQTHIPDLFKSIFKNAFLKFRDAQVLKLFLDEINGFSYDHSEELGNAFEYLLDTMGTQGQNGQFRTPRNIIEFIVDVIDPQKEDTILDPACGTAGFLISAYKHIMAANTSPKAAEKDPHAGDRLTSGQRDKLTRQVVGYDITPLMCRLSRVNMYLHHFANPVIHEYDTLTNKNRWGDKFDVILANPPFMTPSGGVRTHDKFRIAANRAEVLFADFILEHLAPNGRAGFIVPEGIIFQNNNDYISLRKWLINEAGLWAVVSLPAQIFQPYSGVKTSVILVDRALARQRGGILLVKVENDGFSLNTNRTPIQPNDLPAALQLLTAAKRSDYAAQLSTLNSQLPLAHRLVQRADFAKLDAYKSATAAWEFCRRFRTRADRLEKALAEAKAAKDQDESENAHKALAKVREEFPAATGLAKLPKTEAELRTAFDKAIKERAIAYGTNPQQPCTLTADLLKTLDSERDYNLSSDRYREDSIAVSSWPSVSVGDVFRKSDQTVLPESLEGPVTYLGLENITQNTGYIEGNVVTENPADIKSLKNIFKPGNILYGKLRPNLNKVWLADRKGICSTDIFVLEAAGTKGDPALYAHLFRSPRFNSAVTAELKGAQLPRIGWSSFAALQIPLPPLEVQKEIATEIDSYQKVIDGARAVLDHYCPHIPIHPDWPKVELGHLCAIKSGGTPDRSNPSYWHGNIPWVTTTLIDYEVIASAREFITEEGLRNSPTWLVPKGTVLMAMYGQGVTRGRVAILGIDAAINQACVAFQPKDNTITPEYLFRILQSRYEDLRRISEARGGNQSNLSAQVLKEYQIPVPPLATQQAIGAEIQAEQKLIAANRELITRFETKIQSTLARVWGGATTP